jgi:hypothetical protein
MLALVGVLVLIAIAGAAGVADSTGRTTTIDSASAQRGRMAIAAFDMYRSLSDADATVTSTFLPGLTSNTEGRSSDYDKNIARAASAVTTLSEEAASDGQKAIVDDLSASMPIYTGLVETARTYYRQGKPLGLAYLRDASALAQERMLPKLKKLQSSSMKDLGGANDSATSFPWLAALAMLLTLGALGYVQVRISRSTNRVLNPGLVVASTLMLVCTIWLGVSWGVASSHMNEGYSNGADPLVSLSQADISAQRARSDEALTLIAQGGDTDYEKEFSGLVDGLTDADGSLTTAAKVIDDPALDRDVKAATAAAKQWKKAHAELHKKDSNGDYQSAVSSVTAGEAHAAFEKLDKALTRANDRAAQSFTTQTAKAGSALSLSGLGFAVLAVVSMIAAAAGIQRRISEYR